MFLKVLWKIISQLAGRPAECCKLYLLSHQMEKAREGAMVISTLTDMYLSTIFSQTSKASLWVALQSSSVKVPVPLSRCGRELCFPSSLSCLETSTEMSLTTSLNWDIPFLFLFKYCWALPEHAQKAFSYHWNILSDLRIFLTNQHWKCLFRLLVALTLVLESTAQQRWSHSYFLFSKYNSTAGTWHPQIRFFFSLKMSCQMMLVSYRFTTTCKGEWN